jgi:hypothetical protein
MPDRRYLPVAQEVVTDEIIVAAVNRSSVVMPGDLVEAMERAWGVRPGGA